MPDESGNGLRYKVDDCLRRVERLERYEPAVMLRRMDDLDKKLDEVEDRLKWQTRALIGAMLSMLGTLAVVLLVVPHG